MLVLRIALVLLIFVSASPKEEYLSIFNKSITVKGNTSVGKFSCTYETSNNQGDTLLLSQQTSKKPLINFTIPVKAFGCGNMMLNRDFQKTLNAKEYPVIKVDVLNMTKSKGSYIGKLRIKIAGKEKIFDKVVFKESVHDNKTSLESTLCLIFSDFDLQAPQKFGGLIVVDEELEVTIELSA